MRGNPLIGNRMNLPLEGDQSDDGFPLVASVDVIIPLVSHGAAEGEGESFVFRQGKSPSIPLLFFSSIKMLRKSSQSRVTPPEGACSSARKSLADLWLRLKRRSESPR